MNELTFNGTFWLSLCGVVAGIIGLIFGAVNKSKCKRVSCCFGFFNCIRDTAVELELEEHRIDHNVPDSPTNRV